MKNKTFVLVAGAIAIVVFGALFLFSNRNQEPAQASQTPSTSGPALFLRPHSPSFGNALARVTVTEWFDPECESCRVVHPFVKSIIKDYEDRVRFVLRYMPYHHNSMYAASALEEAKELGKFSEALDLLFEKQPEWGSHQQPRPELIPTYLATLGIPAEKLEREYLLKKHSDKIRLDEADGNALGVRGTPSFFVNGQPIRELSEEALREAIKIALSQNQ